jgi:protein-disulfide isomerase
VPPILVFAAGATWFAFDPGFKGIGPGGADAPASDAFEQRVHDYLLKNPQVVVEALQGFEERTRAAEEGEGQKALKAHADEVFRDPATPVGGNPEGDVTMVEFFDYNCPYCRKVESVVLETEKADPKLRIVFKEFPILGASSVFAAKAALAANRQGRYVAFHKALM